MTLLSHAVGLHLCCLAGAFCLTQQADSHSALLCGVGWKCPQHHALNCLQNIGSGNSVGRKMLQTDASGTGQNLGQVGHASTLLCSSCRTNAHRHWNNASCATCACATRIGWVCSKQSFPTIHCRTCLVALEMTTQPQWSSRSPTWTWLMWDRMLAKTCWPTLALATAWGGRPCTLLMSQSHINSMLQLPPPDLRTNLAYIHRLVCAAFICPLLMPAEPLLTHLMKLELTRL